MKKNEQVFPNFSILKTDFDILMDFWPPKSTGKSTYASSSGWGTSKSRKSYKHMTDPDQTPRFMPSELFAYALEKLFQS